MVRILMFYENSYRLFWHRLSPHTGSAHMSRITRRLGWPALGKDCPNNPCRLIAPFAAGTGGDANTREIAAELIKVLGQSVVVLENRSGASNTIGMEAAAKVEPYGYTLVIGITTTLSMAPHLDSKVAYKVCDCAPISINGLLNTVLIPLAPGHGQDHADGCRSGETGEDQGQHSCQGGTPPSGHQAAVLLRQGQVPGVGQEHGQPRDAVCAEQSVDGAQAAIEHATGMGAPEIGQGAAKEGVKSSRNSLGNALRCRHLKSQPTTAASAVVVQIFPHKEAN
jgi:hypothetical protein